ncbi:MAG: UvrD-helicase domain-containing protein [Deltaproteobacteria bacterium]|nr:UvrD-helicase domain-containing protein [Deltaproteobacteria bacterium]
MPFLRSLNPLQLKAATHGDGPLLVLAGAGSGKTKVLTSRIAHLVINKKVQPGGILAVTFTNKAAAEIKERLQALIGKSTGEMCLGTFHTAGLRILQEEAKQAVKKGKLTIFDDEEQLLLVRLIMSELSLDEKDVPSKMILYEINLAKNNNTGVEEYRAASDDSLSRTTAAVYSVYQKKLKSMNAVDFGDLISEPIRLLQSNPAILDKYGSRYRYILVDEYQDTNISQYTLTRLLASRHGNLCVVGDPDQSIYGWRGASLKNILNFREDYPGAVVIKLEQNYRSTKNILSAANSVIRNNSERLDKTLWTGNHHGEAVHYEECLNEYQEARFVVNRTRKLMSEDASIKYRDFVVLYRTNTQSRTFEELFFEEGIPYNIIGGFKFFDRREIKDTLSYLKAIVNPDDSLNFLRIINVPPRGIGKAAIEKVHSISRDFDLSLYESFRKAVNDRAFSRGGGVADFMETFEAMRSESSEMPIHEFTSRLLIRTGYLAFWDAKKTEDVDERLKNLDGLVASIKNYEVNHPRSTIADYLNLVALMSDADGFNEKHNKVTLMTIHSAKGLEFPYVFLTGLEEGLFPHKRSIEEETVEEERRLCYVGMTRAGRQLFLLSAKNRSSGKETNLQVRSRFIEEIDAEYLKKNELEPKGTAEEHMEKIRRLLNS